MTIRSYKIEDRESLMKIFKSNTPKFFDREELQDFQEYLDQRGDTYLTILYKGKIIGGTGYYVKESDASGRISWIFFHPDYSGQGFGKRVVVYCLDILRADPIVKKLVINTSQFACRFFEKFGYELVKIEKDYWGTGLDLYLMEKGL